MTHELLPHLLIPLASLTCISKSLFSKLPDDEHVVELRGLRGTSQSFSLSRL